MEKILWVFANGTNLRSFFPVMNVTAVQTNPNLFLLAFEYAAFLNIFQKSAVSQLMLFFDFGYAFEKMSDSFETFLLGHFRKLRIYFRPFIVFASRGIQ